MEEQRDENCSSELKSKEFWSGVLAEFLGTTFLVYIVSSVSNEYLMTTVSSCEYLHISFAYGLGTATLSLWPNAEGLFNPALAVAFTSTGKLLFTKGVLFIVMEIIGGIAGASLTYALSPEASRSNTTLGDTVLSVHISTIQGLFIEFLLTFILTLAVYAAKDPGRNCRGYDVSLAYGFAVMVCHFVGYKHTSCGVNPARSFGPAVVRHLTGVGKPHTEWEYHWIYWIGPVGGALLGGVLYHFMYSRPSQDYDISKVTASTARDRYRVESETIL